MIFPPFFSFFLTAKETTQEKKKKTTMRKARYSLPEWPKDWVNFGRRHVISSQPCLSPLPVPFQPRFLILFFIIFFFSFPHILLSVYHSPASCRLIFASSSSSSPPPVSFHQRERGRKSEKGEFPFKTPFEPSPSFLIYILTFFCIS